MRLALLATALAAGLTSLWFLREPSEGSGDRQPRPAVIALIGAEVNGHTGRLEGPHVARLVRISLPGGAIEAERTLGPRLRRSVTSGPAASALVDSASVLAGAPDGATVFALERRPRGRDSVAVVDALALETRRSHPLQPGVRYRGLRLGRSGRIYAYGVGRGSVPIVTVLDANGALIASRPVPGRTRRNWWVYGAAPSADERRFMLTYHGNDTTGADWLDLSGGEMRRCAARPRDRACVFEVHGAVEPFRTGFLATTGSDVIQLSRNGRVIRRLGLEPRNVHLMDFVLDGEELYVSSCGRRPAIRRFDLARGRVRTMRSGRVCGAPFAVGAGVLVLAGGRVDRTGYANDEPRLLLVALGNPDAAIRVARRGRPLDAIIVGARPPSPSPR